MSDAEGRVMGEALQATGTEGREGDLWPMGLRAATAKVYLLPLESPENFA